MSAPADRYVLFEAEEQGFTLPAACRMGCCTACAVKARACGAFRGHSLTDTLCCAGQVRQHLAAAGAGPVRGAEAPGLRAAVRGLRMQRPGG